MKIAVTGAFGFVGRYVVAELERRGIHPLLVARPGAVRPPHAQGHEVVEMDLRHAPVDSFERLARPDTLIHLAWGGLPDYASLHHFAEELPAQYRFLSGLISTGLRNLVTTGTCFEYGMQSGQLDESVPTRPSNPYGYAKDSLRTQLQYLQRDQPFNLTWARMFYLYGDGHAPSSLWSLVKAAVQRGDAVFDMSGGEQLRDYLEISQAARAIVMLALTVGDHGVVNVCSGEPSSVRRLVETWLVRHNWQIKLNLGRYPYPTYEPMAFWGSRRKLDASVAALETR